MLEGWSAGERNFKEGPDGEDGPLPETGEPVDGSAANIDLDELDNESDDSIKFFGKPIEVPEEMLESPEYKVQTVLNEWIPDSEQQYKYPRNLYWGDLLDIEDCLIQYFVDKTW